MALVVRPHSRPRHSQALDAMHQLRWDVFIRSPGQELDTSRGEPEVDVFDGAECSYLLQFGPDGRLHGSMRLTPSEQANLSCDVLGPRLGCSFPRDAGTVEIARECYAPKLTPDERALAERRLYASLRRLSLKEGWTRAIGLLHARRIQQWVRSGAETEILGGPYVFPGDTEQSFAVSWRQGPAPLDLLDPDDVLGRLQDPDGSEGAREGAIA